MDVLHRPGGDFATVEMTALVTDMLSELSLSFPFRKHELCMYLCHKYVLYFALLSGFSRRFLVEMGGGQTKLALTLFFMLRVVFASYVAIIPPPTFLMSYYDGRSFLSRNLDCAMADRGLRLPEPPRVIPTPLVKISTAGVVAGLARD